MTFFLLLGILQAPDVGFRLAKFQSAWISVFSFVLFDIMIERKAGFTLGFGQIYLSYNADAFGAFAFSTGHATY